MGVAVAGAVHGAQVDRGADVEAVDGLRPARERFECCGEAEVVERGGPELCDQVAQPVDLVAEALEHDVHGGAQRLPVLEVPGVGELQAQRADSLDALVVDLARPPGALVLARLHAVAQAFDLDGALGCEALRDAGGEGAERVTVGTPERPVGAQRDDEAAALALEVERLDEHGARLEAEFVQPGGLMPARALERERLAGEVDGAELAALHGDDPQPGAPASAGRCHAQLAALLDDDD